MSCKFLKTMNIENYKKIWLPIRKAAMSSPGLAACESYAGAQKAKESEEELESFTYTFQG